MGVWIAAAERRPPCGPPPRGRVLPARASARGALLQPCLESAIEVSVDRQIVGQQLGVDLLDFGQALVLLPLIDAADAENAEKRRQHEAQPQPARSVDAAEHVAGERKSRHALRAARIERTLARRAQALGDRRPDVGAAVEDLADLAGEELLVHWFRV